MNQSTEKDVFWLVVEDDAGMRDLLLDELREHVGGHVYGTQSLAEAREMLRTATPELVVADLKLPDGEGAELLEDVQQAPTPPAFVIITAFGSIPQAVEALKKGADDFLTKPVDLDHLRLRVERLVEVHRLKREVQTYRHQASEPSFHGILARSESMRRLFEEVRRIGPAKGSVVVVGESGVGKEMVARAVHAESPRRDGPFIPVNCAAVPESLVESELFGHVAGAFTGAERSRPGLFAEARHGTLLLDEITELPQGTQAKLLRVLQEGKVRPVGANREEKVDARVVAASNRGIQREVAEGRLREDLYYRLETFTLDVPPLRERPEDVEVLASHFLAQVRFETGSSVEGLSEEALDTLRRYDFPGNVRELRNVIERAVTFCRGREIQPSDLGPRLREQASQTPSTSGLLPALIQQGDLPSLEELKTRYIRYVVRQLGGNKRRAAALLGIGRRTLYRYLEP